jgi:transcriptional regulator with XRE-family HTH domain
VDRAQVYLKFIGANVHRLRTRQALTQDQFEELSGLDVRFIRRVERGVVNLRFDTFIRLAVALGVEPGQLLKPARPVVPRVGRPKRRQSAPR